MSMLGDHVTLRKSYKINLQMLGLQSLDGDYPRKNNSLGIDFESAYKSIFTRFWI